MLKKYRCPFSKTFRFLDFLIVLFSLFGAFELRFGSGGFYLLRAPLQYQVFLLVYVACWLYLSDRFQLYTSKRLTQLKDEVWDVCKTTVSCLVIASVPAFFLREYPLSRIFLSILWPLQTAVLIFSRLVSRSILRYIRGRGYNYRNVLIIGRNERAGDMVQKIEQNPELGLRMLGFIDKENGKASSDPASFWRLKFLGTLTDLATILKRDVVDEVFVFLPIKSFYSEIQDILLVCEKVGVEIKIPTDLFNLKVAKSAISTYDGIPLIGLYTSPEMNWQLVVKRSIDVAISAVLLVLFSPLFAVVSVLVKMTSRGPIFFKQQRVGYNGRIFSCLKFRTMVENAEALREALLGSNELSGPVFKIRNDPRVTRIGRFLRKTSMDELPQLINVLLGDMSLVGPRPPIPSEVDQYDLDTLRRLSMKPGITCIWQVNGRNSISFEKWMDLDRQYIDQWSLSLDFKILAKTIPAVLRGSGAS